VAAAVLVAGRDRAGVETIQVVVVDDHELFRGGIVQLLGEAGVDVIGQFGLAEPAIAMIRERRPDVVLMDIHMPGMSGIEATQRLHAAVPGIPVIVLSAAADEPTVTAALLAGARGYALKDAPVGELVQSIRAAARGEAPISPRVAGHLVQRMRRPAGNLPVPAAGSGLTSREHEILDLIARGIDNPDIARALFLSPHTVKHHVSSILDKLEVENRIQAAVQAVRRGLV
jgi:DNA-binding NarL/FixJ family response regulator